jgi:Ser/Thr protein kinase RdoA (MazF antagonist)
VELLAEGRTAQVFAYGAGRVLKLDRPEWNGLAPFEGEVLARLAEAGLPVARAHGAVTVEGRSGIVLDRVDGGTLAQRLHEAPAGDVEGLAEHFVELQLRLHDAVVPGLSPLVPRLQAEITSSMADEAARTDLLTLLHRLDDGALGVCHYDLSPDNVLVGPDGWVVVDWITAGAGPSPADLARTLVMWGRQTRPTVTTFLQAVRRLGAARRGLDDETLDDWVRVVAAARLGEGFSGDEAAWLRRVARGGVRLCA